MPAVRLDDECFEDDRFDTLAKLCGFVDGDYARIKCARLWRQCTRECRYVLDRISIELHLGPDGSSHLVAARLGVIVKDGVRIRGTKGRVEWLRKLRKNGQKGGRAKASKSYSETPSNSSSNSPAPAVARTEKKKEREKEVSGSGSSRVLALVPDQPRAPEPPNDRPVERERDPEPSPSLSTGNPQGVDRGAARSRGFDVPAPRVHDPALLSRLVNSFVVRMNEARKRLGAEFGIKDLRALNHQDEGGDNERELRERLKASADPEGDLNHVLAIAERDVRKTREFKWFGWSLIERKAWRSRLADVMDGGAAAESKRPRDPSIGRYEPPADSEYEDNEGKPTVWPE